MGILPVQAGSLPHKSNRIAIYRDLVSYFIDEELKHWESKHS
jgi:hypothetical protein